MSSAWRARFGRLREHPGLARVGPDLLAALICLVPPLVLFAAVTFGGRMLVPYDALLTDPSLRPAIEARGIQHPQNDLVADLVFQNVVWKDYLAGQLAAGQMPLWNPYLAGGMPFLAAGQHSALYPLTLLFLLLSPDRAFGWQAVLNLWLAALAMLVFGRALGLGRFASVLMGVAWSMSSLFVANTVFPMIQAGMTWLPVVLAGITAVTRSIGSDEPPPFLPRGRATLWLVAISLAILLSGLAGHPEIFYYNALVALAWAVFRLILVGRDRGWATGARIGLWLGGAAVAGVLLAAIQLVPLAELAGTSWRGAAEAVHAAAAEAPGEVAERLAGYAFGERQAITFVLPDFYGNPAHHAVPGMGGQAQVALADHAMWGTAYGAKNYVEAASYLGILALLLALVGLAAGRPRATAWFFAGLGLVALSIVFGLPTYRLLYSVLPGFEQLRTPFRWVFVVDLALVVLAGLGADGLVRGGAARAGRLLGGAALAGGLGLGMLLGLAWLTPSRWTGMVEGLFLRLPIAESPEGSQSALDIALGYFPDGAALAAYQYWNLMHLAVFMILAGTVVLLLAHAAGGGRDLRPAMALALATVVLDLGLIGFGFNPAVDPALADPRPPVATFLREAIDVKWGRVMGYGPERVLWPNTPMRWGIPDLRAYDSILPWWTVDTLLAIEDQSGMLTYNRIGNLQTPAALAHPGLQMLAARYIVSREPLEAPGLVPIYSGEGEVKVYENTRALRRAWVVNEVKVIADRAALLAELGRFDPATTVLLEQPPEDNWAGLPAGRNLSAAINVRRDTETPNGFEVDVSGAPSGGMLVLSDAWFPGWKAWVEVSGPGGLQSTEVPIYRANGMLRAVPVPPGRSTVRLAYSPMSLKIGLYAAFLGAILIILALAYALWGRFVRVDGANEMQRIAVNTAGPIAANLLNKVILFAFAMLMYRVLDPEEAGNYYAAITIIGFVDIFANFGLNLLAAREVARAPDEAGRYLTHTTVLRMLMWLLAIPLLAGYIVLTNQSAHPMSDATVMAIALFALALIPSNLNAAVSSIFQAREKMVLPAGVAIVSTLVSVALGALALLAGYGFVGLAVVSIATNWVTFMILAVLATRDGIRPKLALEPALLWAMVGVGLPLMLNHLLQTVFFKIDVLLLRQLLRDGATVVGWYSAAYKWIDALLILPAFFTMALFPLMSRRAAGDRPGLARTLATGQRWLISIALPIAVATTFMADGLVQLLAGADYLPQGGTALKVMIWFLPLSFANGLAQYVLIAIHRQRWIMLSFVIAVVFNVVGNWLVIPGHVFGTLSIPAYTFVGAAVVMILSEVVLRLAFSRGLRELDAPPLVVLAWRPAVAAGLMAALMGVLDAFGLPPIFNVGLGVPLYLTILLLSGGITADDRAILARLRPGSAADSAGGSASAD